MRYATEKNIKMTKSRQTLPLRSTYYLMSRQRRQDKEAAGTLASLKHLSERQ